MTQLDKSRLSYVHKRDKMHNNSQDKMQANNQSELVLAYRLDVSLFIYQIFITN